MVKTKKLAINLKIPSEYKSDSSHHEHSDSFTSIRKAQHRGRKIEIKTTYSIKIDDKPFTLHTMVMDDGTIHCHGLPNYSFPSAIDLVKSVIDASRLVSREIDEIGKSVSDSDGQPVDHHDSDDTTHGGNH